MPDNSDFLQDYRTRLERALGTGSGFDPTGEQGPGIQTPDLAGNPSQGLGPTTGNTDTFDPPNGRGPELDRDTGQTDDGQDETQGLPYANGGQGAGPMIAPSGGRGAGLAPQAPTMAGAPQAPQAPLAPTAPNAPTAQLAPTMADQSPNGPPPAQPGPTPGIAPGPQAGGPPPPSGPGAPPPDINAGGDAARQPANEHKNGEKLPDGRPGIQVHPDNFDASADFDQDKLKNLQATNQNPRPSDMFNALKPKSQTKYMDWWEQQHGEIEDRYSQLQKELGQRPDPEANPTRKDQFKMLMDFGISLLQNGARGADPIAGYGNALHSAVAGQQQRQQQRTADYDRQASTIQKAKQDDLKDIGNYGQAMREDAMITDAQTRTAIAQAKALNPPKPGNPQTRVLDNGVQVQWDPEQANPKDGTKGVWKVSTDDKGNAIKVMPGGGKNGQAGHVSANLQSIQDMVGHGVPYATAVSTVYHIKPTNDPTKTYTSIYNTARKNGSDPDDAKAEALDITNKLHGAGAIERTQAHNDQTLIPTNAPPKEKLAGLVPGKVRDFGKYGRWTVDSDGNPQPVH